MSTVEILVIPPFLAAVLILASALKNRTPKNPVAVASPTLVPTGLLVAATGKVSEQLDIIATTASNAKIVFTFLILIKFKFSYS